MAESTEYEPSRRHWWGERTTNASSAGSKFIYPDWLLWPDLATTPPITCLPTIVYTLLIGSLFLRERDEDMYHWCSDVRDTSVAFVKHIIRATTWSTIVMFQISNMFLSTIDNFTNNWIHNRDYIAIIIICCASVE